MIMTPQTIHWICQDLQAWRASLTHQETWWQKQEPTPARAECFRRITFLRKKIKDIEAELIALNS